MTLLCAKRVGCCILFLHYLFNSHFFRALNAYNYLFYYYISPCLFYLLYLSSIAAPAIPIMSFARFRVQRPATPFMSPACPSFTSSSLPDHPAQLPHPTSCAPPDQTSTPILSNANNTDRSITPATSRNNVQPFLFKLHDKFTIGTAPMFLWAAWQ